MKKLSYLLMCVFTLGFFAACSDDDDDKTNYAAKIAGTYAGELVVKMGGQEVGKTDKDIAVAVDGEKQVKVSLKDFSMPIKEEQVTIPEVVITGITVSEKEGVVTLSEKTQDVKIDQTVTASVTVSGQVDKENKLTLKIKVATPAVEADFTGAKKTK